VLVNYTDQPITFALYSADGLNTPVGGGFALKPQNVPQVDVGSWVHVPIGGILVPPRTQDTIPFTMTVPLNAQPGDHAGGIVARDVTGQVQQSGPSQVIVAPGIGARIYTRVKGPLHPGLAVTNGTINGSYGPFAWVTGSGQGKLRFRVLNTGNVLLNAQAKIKAVDLLGHTVKSFTAINLPALLPGAVAYLTLPSNNLPRLGRVSYDVSVRAPETSKSTSFQKWLIPWVLIAIVVVLLALIWLWTWWRRRRHRAAETPKPPEPEVAAVR
jgi:hypothetical protein